ncbi:Replication protein [Edwardsiella tarda]|uniref:Replication protein n=1 Tax=Edwardsiella tarda TaxID=636 RepID=UPI002FCCC1D7
MYSNLSQSIADNLSLSPNRRGAANAARKGQRKIHRRYQPQLCCRVSRGMASKVVARISRHDWNRNGDLIALRQRGYIPYTYRHDPHFVPKPMRISTRSESREALTVLSQALAAHTDYNPDSDYPFEVMVPFEQIASAMGVLHVYESGRKAYDVALHALSVMEQLGYVIVLHTQDSDSGQNKPLRIWLSETFFTSRGIQVDEIRDWLGKFKRWAMKNGLTETLRQRYEKHLVRIERIGIDLKSRHSLRNRLRQIKRWVVSPDLARDKAQAVAKIEQTLAQRSALEQQLDETNQNIRQLAKGKKQNSYYQQFTQWSINGGMTTIHVMMLQEALKQEHPGLLQQDAEAFYKLLLERAGAFKI